MDKLPFAILQQYVNLPTASAEVHPKGADIDSGSTVLVGTARLVRGGELLGLDDRGSSPFPRDNVDVSRFPLILPITIDERTVDKFFNSFTTSVTTTTTTTQTITEIETTIKDEFSFTTPERKPVVQSQDDEQIGAVISSPSVGSSSTSAATTTKTTAYNHVGKVLDISVASPIKKTAGIFSPRSDGGASSDDKNADPPVHLIVLQHGFLGCSYDMKLLQNAMKVELPPYTQVITLLTGWVLVINIFTFQILCAKANEEHTQDSIAQMGKRLAFEVTRYCQGGSIPMYMSFFICSWIHVYM